MIEVRGWRYYRVRSMHAELYQFFCASFSAQQFRRWVRRLPPGGLALAQALPEGHVDSLTLFDQGADLLIRQSCVDAAFFTALSHEFPKRHAELVGLARRCGVHWVSPGVPPKALPTTVYWLWLPVTLCLGAALVQHFWAPSADDMNVELKQIEPYTAPLAAVMLAASPETQATPDTGEASGGEGPDLKDTKKPKRHPKKVVLDSEAEPPPTIKIAPVTCEIPDALRTELSALARKTLRSPGLSDEFTVILHDGAVRPNVSPVPGPGDTAGEQFYRHLAGLGPTALGHCRETPIDVAFSTYKTTVDLRQ